MNESLTLLSRDSLDADSLKRITEALAKPKVKLSALLNITLRNVYLDWFNNYLTIDAFASDYGLTRIQADDIINISRSLHEEYVKNLKKASTRRLAPEEGNK